MIRPENFSAIVFKILIIVSSSLRIKVYPAQSFVSIRNSPPKINKKSTSVLPLKVKKIPLTYSCIHIKPHVCHFKEKNSLFQEGVAHSKSSATPLVYLNSVS